MLNTNAMQGMLYRTLGSTGEKVSVIGIGGWHIGLNGVDEQLSIRIIRTYLGNAARNFRYVRTKRIIYL
jgi:aryl-alcohol dehydrogenase-like predicted oxidoreductase